MQKTVNIGPTAGRIGDITKDHIHFIDEFGENRSILMLPHFPSWPSNMVGIRKLDEAPWTVKLSGDEGIAFIFESYEAAYKLLLIPLKKLGLDTMDAT